MALSGRQSWGNGAPQRGARKSPRATFPSIGPSWPPVPGEAALLKGGRAKVRAQPLLSIGPFWPPAPGERRSLKEGAQKSARNLSFHWLFLAASPGGTALLKGGRAKVRAQSFLPLALRGRQSRGKRRSSKEGAQKSARSLFHPLALPGHQSRGNGAPQRRARKSLRAASSIHWPFLATSPGGTALLKGGRAKVRSRPLLSIDPSWPPVPGERRSSKEGAQKSARSLFFPLALSGHQSRGNGAPQRRARKSPRAASSFHWPFLAASPARNVSSKEGAQKSARSLFFPWALPGHQSWSPGGTTLLKGGRAKVRAQPLPSIGPFWPPVPGERRSSKEGAQKSARSLFFPLALPGQRRARKSRRAASPFHWPFLATSPGGTALLKGGRAKVRAQSFLPLALRGRQSRKKRRSSKEGAQKSARSLFFPLALPGHQSRGNGAPQRRARKSQRAASSFHWPFLAASPAGNVSSKEGAQKSTRSLFFPLALPGHQSWGNDAPQRGRAKVRAQPLLSIGPFWPPVPGERRSSKGGAQKSARDLSFHWPFLAASSGGSGAPQRRARKSPRAASSFHGPFLVTSPGGTALLKGGRAKVRAQPLVPPCTGERRSSKEGAQKSARNLSFRWLFLATSVGGTALLKGGRAKVRAQSFLPLAPSWPPVPGERRSSKEGAQKSARSLFHPLAFPGHQFRGNGAPQRRARKSPRAASSDWPFLHRGRALLKGGRAKVRAQPLLSIGPSWPPVLGERRSSKEGAQLARSLSFPLALSGHQSRGNGAPQRGARKSPRATFPSISPSWLPVPGEAALLKGGRAKVRAQPLPSMGPSWSPVSGERRSSKEGAQKSAASSFHWPFLATSPGGTALLKGGRAKVRAQTFLPLTLSGHQPRGNGDP